MQKIKIRLPATITNLGPGLSNLGLALGLYVSVEISRRDNHTLNIYFDGEGAETFKTPLRNPVMLGMSRLFQYMEKTVTGIDIRITNQIPLKSGLGAEAAFMVAGVLGANDMLGHPFKRDEIMELAARFTRADAAVTALMGGLTTSLLDNNHFYQRTLPVKPLDLVVVVPELDKYSPSQPDETIPLADALHNLSRLPLVIEALRIGDVSLLAEVIEDKLLTPLLKPNISGYGHVMEMGRRAGALAITTCGEGPALMAIAESGHRRIAEDMRLAFQSTGVGARSWILPVDTQGVVISAVQSA